MISKKYKYQTQKGLSFLNSFFVCKSKIKMNTKVRVFFNEKVLIKTNDFIILFKKLLFYVQNAYNDV